LITKGIPRLDDSIRGKVFSPRLATASLTNKYGENTMKMKCGKLEPQQMKSFFAIKIVDVRSMGKLVVILNGMVIHLVNWLEKGG
jgi:hypothetical protein